ncbi:hypothetical protein [Cryobacterium shii]|uniref:Uncharacterized protein n=1 Tax=Cryobacterium shii TaxID=1259235 RepID=A0AAQ2HFY6_9MICO|nr:hypothetical protein [Cryobacterium shii]TFC48899.1 hypothetical protein E3O49_06730 [Cryobacterium shii]
MKVYRAFRQSLPALTQAAGAVVLAVYPLVGKDHRWIPVSIGIALALGGALWTIFLRPTRNSLLATIANLRKQLNAHDSPDGERMTFVLGQLLHELGLSGPEHRASVFARHDDGTFTLAGRYSANGNYRIPGRAIYAASEGLVAATWGDMQSHRADLPTRRPAWNKAVAKQFNMPEAVVAALRMQSLSYVCMRIDRPEGASTRPVGVLIVESTDKEGATAEMLDEIPEIVFWRLLPTECHSHVEARRIRETSKR